MKTYHQFIVEGVKEYEITYKMTGGSHDLMTVEKGETEDEAKAAFKRAKPHTHIVKIKKRGLLHKIANLGRDKNAGHGGGEYRTNHSHAAGHDIDPASVPTFQRYRPAYD